jgi:hypothetical protein
MCEIYTEIEELYDAGYSMEQIAALTSSTTEEVMAVVYQ